MTAKTSPFVEAKYGWDFGESGWNGGVDENFVKFGFLFDSNIDDIVSALPPLVNGKAYYLTTDKRLYFAVGGVFYSTSIPKYFKVTIRSTGVEWYFDGTDLVLVPVPVPLTAGDIKSLYESNPNTNAFTDPEKLSLSRAVDVKGVYGLVGDGVTNDTAGLQAALSAFSGKVLTIPPGTYKTNTLNIPTNTTVLAYGCTFDFSATSQTGFNFSSGGGLAGAKLIGSGNASFNPSGVAVQCRGVRNHPAVPTFVNGPIVKECEIDGWSNYGVFFEYVNGGFVSKNKLKNIGYAGVAGISCNDTIVQENTVDTITPGSPGGDAYGIFIDRNNGLSETSDPRSYRCSIISNIVKNVSVVAGDNGQGIDTHAGVDFKIIGNTVSNCEAGIWVTASVINGLQQLGPKRCIVQGNNITGPKVGYGLLVSGAIQGISIIDYAEGNIIEGNSVEGFGLAGSGTTGAIVIQGTKGTKVSNNVVKNAACNSMYINFSNIAFNVTDNIFIDPHDNTYATPACIRINGSDNRGFIGGNTFRFEASGLGTNVATNSIRIETSLSGLDLELGRSSFVGIDATHLRYVEGTNLGVNSSGLLVQSGSATLALTNSASNTLSVTFPKRFPISSPNVVLSRDGSPIPGTVTKSPQLESANANDTTFTIVARPFDLTTFGGAGSITVKWLATT